MRPIPGRATSAVASLTLVLGLGALALGAPPVAARTASPISIDHAEERPAEKIFPILIDGASYVSTNDLARIFATRYSRHDAIVRLLRPLGLAVWLADVGRLELRAESFLPQQRVLALAS